MTVVSQDYGDGNILIAGEVQTDVVSLAADTYYGGMPLRYEASATAAYVGTGNGTMTLISANSNVQPGAWTFTFTGALTGNLADPNGDIVGQNIALADGAATKIDVDGLRFTITDGATAFAATGVFTITVSSAGVYEYYADFNEVDGFYNGSTKTLDSAGYGSVVLGGAIYEGGIVDGSGDAITITAADRAALAGQGFYVKREA
jgi:hypothetical protein